MANITQEKQLLKTDAGCDRLNILTGETEPFIGECYLEANESVMIISDYRAGCVGYIESNTPYIMPEGKWQIKSCTHNAMTLDICDYYFDGQLIERDAYVLDIQTKACDLGRKVNVRCDWAVEVEDVPDTVYLGIETPEVFNITINGKAVDKTPRGTFTDKSIVMLDIRGYLTQGNNIITTECDFVQSEETYKTYELLRGFEGIKNRFTYDMEIEPMYLIGSFGVKDTSEVKKIDRKAEKMKRGFAIAKMPAEVDLTDIQAQGFRFFAGEMTLTKKINLDGAKGQVLLNKKGINAINISANGGKKHLMLWEPLTADLSDDLQKGENELEITLVNNLRNLMGPHHLEGESYNVGPASFYKNNHIWDSWPPRVWDDDYCFVETEILFLKGE